MRSAAKKTLIVTAILSTGLSLTACGGEDSKDNKKPTAAASSSQAAPAGPTAADLHAILARAVDPNVPTEQKLDTVVDGDKAPELFDALTKASVDSKAKLEVMEPVLPSALPGIYTASVNLIMPDRQPQLISGVEFVEKDGKYKLERKWACDLVSNVVPQQVPPMCNQPG